MTTIERFMAKVDKTDTCWLWTASKNPKGYGYFSVNQKTYLAHRFSYLMYKGSISKNLQLDHLCRVRNCVNPEHLEAVTSLENSRRGIAGQNNRIKTHCPQGHEYNKTNTRIYKNERRCRPCGRLHTQNYRANLDNH